MPIGYLMARFRFRGKAFVDGMLDVPIVLPPLVLGLGLLILFQTRIWGGRTVEDWIEAAGKALLPIRLFGHEFLDIRLGVTYRVPAVILAQYMVSCAFAVRTMRSTFEQISPRQEEVAMTLGGSRRQAFFGVTLPRARTGLLAAFTLAWARALGEFGPILIFAGATRRKTEVLSTTVFLEMSAGNVENAVAVSLLMVAAAALALTVIRVFGHRSALE
ncbi:MAG: Sulfate transport system permease protein CysW [candidate division BRC1 bacterium ADurb.BinA364]|nr:MAG: Sulfate transport system permease protein CysW [candidate division BRC1 bacterium ADurb.BinA364]